MSLYAKLWTDILGDEKLLRAERRGAKHLYVLPWLFAFAKKADDHGRLTVDGQPAEPIDIAYGIPCISPKQIERGMTELEDVGILVRDDDEALRLAAWEKRSGHAKPSDEAPRVRERVARHRAKRKHGDVTPGNADDVTPGNGGEIELEIEKEPEKEKELDAEAPRALGESLGSADDITAESLRSSVGDDWPDVRRFLESRKRETRPAWIREMAKLAGPGSQFTSADLAGACADALALDEPLGGPHALRAFVAKRGLERITATTSGSIPTPGKTNGQDEAHRTVAAIKRLIRRNGPSRFIPRTEVVKMGERVIHAYDAVGGAERFLSNEANDVKFLPFAFARALEGQPA